MRDAFVVSVLLLVFPLGGNAAAVPAANQTTNNDRGPSPDIDRLRRIAELGDRRAQFDLAQRLRAQRGRKSKREAEDWFQRASEQGYALGTHMQAVMYWNGEFGYANVVTAEVALKLFEKAAGQGLAWSALAVADAHAKGKRPWMKKDSQRACQWTLIAEGLDARDEWDGEIPKTVNAARRELPERLMRARDSLSSARIAACEEQAAAWLGAHPPRR